MPVVEQTEFGNMLKNFFEQSPNWIKEENCDSFFEQKPNQITLDFYKE